MSNRGLGIISIISGVIAVAIFIMVISAYASSGGGPVVGNAPVVQASPGQPVDSEINYGSGGSGQPNQPAVTPQPVNAEAGQAQQSASQPQPVVAPSANAPANPFTSGLH